MGGRWVWCFRRVLPLVLAAALAFGMTPSAGASLHSRLQRVREKVKTLAHDVEVQERVVARVQDRLALLDRQIDRVTKEAARVRRHIRPLRRRVAEVRARLDTLQSTLDELARSAYMRQAGGDLGTLLMLAFDADSTMDIFDGIELAAHVSEPIAITAQKVDATKAEFERKLEPLQALRSRQLSLLARLDGQRRQKRDLAAEHEKALRRLNRSRAEILEIMRTLQLKWQLSLFPIIGSAFQGGAHTSYGRWAVLFLHTIGAPVCHSNEVVLVAWQLSEFTQAAWNPLATTTPMPGSSRFNDAGVRNFVSLAQGLEATKLTLYNGASGYGAILADLNACAAPITTARAVNASAWCHGCANGQYVVNNVGKVEANFDLYSRF